MMTLTDQAARLWWGWMGPMFWQASLFILIVWGIDRVIRRWAWPQVCYALWLLVILKLLCPPGLASPTSLTAGLFGRQTIRHEAVRDIATPTKVSALPSPSAVLLNPLPGAVAAANAPTPRISAPWWQIAVPAFWLAGFSGLGGLIVFQWRGLRRSILLSNSGSGRCETIERLIADLAGQMRLRRLPRLVFSARVNSPAVFGVLRPMLILPAEYQARESDPELRYILLHELAHVKRGDLLLHSLFIALQAFYWFNPLLWMARKRMQALRELCCDATVAGILKEETPAYRATLLRTAESLLGRPSEFGLGLLGLVEQSGSIVSRLRWLEKKIWRHGRLRLAATLLASLIILLIVFPMARSQSANKAKTIEAGEKSCVAMNADQLVMTGSIAQTRILHFPSGMIPKGQGSYTIFGTVAVGEWPERWTFLTTPHMEIGEASGDVAIPAGKAVALTICSDIDNDLSRLDALRPDDIQVLNVTHQSMKMNAALPHIGRLSGLRVLFLGGISISDEALSSLAGLKQLEALDLQNCPISDAGLRHLEGLTSLRKLWLFRTKVTQAGIDALRRKLPGCDIGWKPPQVEREEENARRAAEQKAADDAGTTCTIRLVAGENNDGSVQWRIEHARPVRLSYGWYLETPQGVVEQDGFSLFADAGPIDLALSLGKLDKSLGLVTKLKEWNIGSTDMAKHGEDSTIYFHKLTPGSSMVRQSHPQASPIVLGQRYQALWSLGFAKDKTAPEERVCFVMRVADPKEAAPKFTPPFDPISAAKPAISDKKYVDLSDIDFNDADLAALKNLHYMRGLSFQVTHVKDDQLKYVGVLDNLEELDFHGAYDITDAGMAHLAGMKNLKDLNLAKEGAQSHILTDAGLAHLAPLTSLRSINLMGNSITDEGLKSLAGMKDLESLDLERTKITDACVQQILGFKKLRNLSLKGTALLADADLAQLAKMTQLERLWLEDCNAVTNEGVAKLGALKALTHLTLSGKGITNAGLAPLTTLPALEYLYLSNTSVGGEGLKELAKIKTLRVLGLEGSPVGDAELAYLAGLDQLRELDLDMTQVTNAGLPALKALPALKTLWLQKTEVSDAGIPALKELGRGLKSLNLYDSKLSKGGLSELRQALPGCQIITP